MRYRSIQPASLPVLLSPVLFPHYIRAQCKNSFVILPHYYNMPSHRNCCVVGCTNTEEKAAGGAKFYSFPAREHEKERKRAWVAAVNRLDSDGTAWEPTKYSRICSEHFVGGAKSNHPHHPAYIPSVFPAVHQRTQAKTCYSKRSRKCSAAPTISPHPATLDVYITSDSSDLPDVTTCSASETTKDVRKPFSIYCSVML